MERIKSLRKVRQASGEKLLMLAVLGNARVKQAVERELDRRARLGQQIQELAREPAWAA